MDNTIKKYSQGLSYKPDILLFIFAFFLPLIPEISQVSIVLYLLFWLKNKQYLFLYKVRQNWFAIGAILYFVVNALTGFYSTNLIAFGADIESKLALLIFPMVLTSREVYDKRIFKYTILLIGLSLFIFNAYLFYEIYLGIGGSFRDVLSLKKVNHLNPIYFAMYCVLVLLILLFYLIKEHIPKLDVKTIFYLTGLFILNFAIYNLASRMAILSLLIIELVIVFLWKIWFQRQFFIGLLLMVSVFIFNSLNIKYVNPSKLRFEKAYDGDVRLEIWEAGLLQFQRSPIIGYGAGDAKDIMLEGYQEIGFDYGVKSKYNCHNQYLESAISAGLIGFLVLIGWLILAFYQGWKAKDYAICISIAVIALNILTESMMERQQGSYFIAFFGSIVFWELLSKNQKAVIE